ncbi:MAG: amidohydrolase [Burkholderiales bacterium]|nr:amidohydrolase [Burkholderiales bacterium]
MRKIDVFNHIQPERYCRHIENLATSRQGIGLRTAGNPRLRDLEHRFRVMDEFGEGYCQVITVPGPQPALLAGPQESPEIARIANDGLAELCSRYPERFVGFAASLPLNNPEAAIREANRAIRELGALGVEIFTNVKGKPLDAAELAPVWDALAALERPVWMHPSRSPSLPDYTSEKKSRYEVWFVFGYPYETSTAMARLVFSGLFDRHPGLKIITHHMGGMTPYFEGRVGSGWEVLGSRTDDEDYSGVLAGLKLPHTEYFKRFFYADTALFGGRAGTVCGLDYFGVDHVLFASDYPFDPKAGQYIRETIAILDGLPVSEADRALIYHGNAERLMGIPAAK